MVSSSPSFSVFLAQLLVLGKEVSLESRVVFSLIESWYSLLNGGFECLFCGEGGLEVHPVLGSIVMLLL